MKCRLFKVLAGLSLLLCLGFGAAICRGSVDVWYALSPTANGQKWFGVEIGNKLWVEERIFASNRHVVLRGFHSTLEFVAQQTFDSLRGPPQDLIHAEVFTWSIYSLPRRRACRFKATRRGDKEKYRPD